MPLVSISVATWWRLGRFSMPVAKLTKRFVDAIEPSSRLVVYYDTEVTGFGLKVTPTGRKSWCVEYRAHGGGRGISKSRMVLGSISTLTPDQARSAAREILAAVALGEDPATSRSRAREMPTFREFADRYLDEEAASKLKPRSVVNYCIYLRKHAGPFIGKLKLDRIATGDIAKMNRRMRRLRLSLRCDMRSRRSWIQSSRPGGGVPGASPRAILNY